MEKQNVIIASNLAQELNDIVGACLPDRVMILTDETTGKLCLPVVKDFDCLREARHIVIPAGDIHKDLNALSHVWSEMQRYGATRHSLLISLGGGMVTDLGGFAASTFKRGVAFINIPTTLLAMVDASVGGKTGINFSGLKNEIGVFRNANCVIIDTQFLQTLDRENILSGYAEMLKHGLIDSIEHWSELIKVDGGWRMVDGAATIAKSIAVKQRIVLEDPHEQGLRKALNLGHTFGHAFESFSMQNYSHSSLHTPHSTLHTPHSPILHGYAVAYGLVCELYLSVVKTGFPIDKMRQTVRFIFDHYGRMPITCEDYPTLLELMTHDKKNTAGTINFTLLGDIGDIRINQTATKEEIEEALDFYREGC